MFANSFLVGEKVMMERFSHCISVVSECRVSQYAVGFVAALALGVGNLSRIKDQVGVPLCGKPQRVQNSAIPLVGSWMHERFVKVVVRLPRDIWIDIATQLEEFIELSEF